MEAYKQEFIEFMVASDVLKFGDFTLKSGRKSPFFMNAGAYVTGAHAIAPFPRHRDTKHFAHYQSYQKESRKKD